MGAKQIAKDLKYLVTNEWGTNVSYLTETSFVIQDGITGELFIVEVSRAEIMKQEDSNG